MRIAIFGAHKVGKTTLAEELLGNLPGYTLEQSPIINWSFQVMNFQKFPLQRISLNNLIIQPS